MTRNDISDALPTPAIFKRYRLIYVRDPKYNLPEAVYLFKGAGDMPEDNPIAYEWHRVPSLAEVSEAVDALESKTTGAVYA